MTAARRPAVALIGAGRLGTTFARLLAGRGYRLGAIVAKRLASARRAVAAAGAGRATTSLRRGIDGARLVLLAVPDRSVFTLAVSLAPLRRWEGRTVLHTAGSLGPEALAPLADAGAAVGCLHPLRSFPPPARPLRSLRGVYATLEGDGKALVLARRLCRDLGLRPLRLAPGERAAYHAAAALASNHLVALADAAAETLCRAGAPRSQALSSLIPLMRGAVDALDRDGLPSALTGPIARGDVETVERHLRALESAAPELEALYRTLSLRAVGLARRAGTLKPASARKLTTLLR
jgi:predicted short-subunit dehydrogenase-like oxidoreductase (DUF2520 family)